MDMRNLYILRFKRGTAAVNMAYVTADNLEKAQEVGKWWCNQSPNTRYVMVEPAVVADQADLKFTSIEERDKARNPPPAASEEKPDPNKKDPPKDKK